LINITYLLNMTTSGKIRAILSAFISLNLYLRT